MFRRSRALPAVLVSLVAVLVALLPWQGASAHGSLTSPASRTYACYVDGLTSTGEIKPQNPACAQAVATGGTQPLYDWYGVLRSDGAGRTEGYIPDGELCSGGNPKYAAYDEPRADWPATAMRIGGEYEFTYGAWVPHPGDFRIYITKDGYDPAQPLHWDDLEDEPFLVADPQPPVTDGAYRMTGQLPQGRSGRHVIYTVWIRSDSAETFYTCSDVELGDGTPTDPPTDPPTASCEAAVTVDNSWSGGFQATVTITNTGTNPMGNWFVQWTMPDGAQVTQGWEGGFMQSGTTAMVHAPEWRDVLAPGDSASAGFLGSSSGPPQFDEVTCG